MINLEKIIILLLITFIIYICFNYYKSKNEIELKKLLVKKIKNKKKHTFIKYIKKLFSQTKNYFNNYRKIPKIRKIKAII